MSIETKVVDGDLTITLSYNDGQSGFYIAEFGGTHVWKIDSNGNLITKGVVIEQYPEEIP